MPNIITHQARANAIRFLAIDAIEQANSGHPGMPMGMADVATILYQDFLRFNPQMPLWHNRDRFVLSAGHGSMLLYALLYLNGYPECDIEQIKNFRQFGYKTAGHPEYGHLAGIETTTGPLGQGLANAVGMALSERMMNARFGDDIINHHIYVIAGDGCLMEGISQEAISFAGHQNLSNLIVLFDDNGITIDGNTALSTSENTRARFEACGFECQQIDGHHPEQIHNAISKAKQSNKPSLICCKTHIGYGSPNRQDTSKAHGAALGSDEIKLVREKLNWPHSPFEIPRDILEDWRNIGRKYQQECQQSCARLDALTGDKKQLWQALTIDNHQKSCADALLSLKQKWHDEMPCIATRKASEIVLNALSLANPRLIGGSADLTGSNNTKAKNQQVIDKDNYAGDYINYGIREHGMAAMMNGMAL
ncbi:MAG: transketolase, partial [Alphaproteobacteria bacterium]|nr:transketolase [Alphaproteobacteria bacterium]